MVLVKQKCTVGGASFDLWIVQLNPEEFMYSGHSIAQFLGYKQPAHAIKNNVLPECRKTWASIKNLIDCDAHLQFQNNYDTPLTTLSDYNETQTKPIEPSITSLENEEVTKNERCISNTPSLSETDQPQTPVTIHPHTVFISDAGVYALIVRSKLPAALQFQRWLYYEVLPALRKNGSYTMKNTVAAYDKKLADAQMEALNLKLQLADNTNKLVTMERDYALQIMEIKQNNALQMMEIRQNYINMLSEQKFKLQLEINNLNAMIDKGSFQFAVNALLARDNIEENTQLRQTLKDIDGCVVPKLDNPEKEEYITCYYRVVDGMNRLRTCRTQLHEIEQHDKKVERYHAASKKFGVIKKPQRYTWLYESHKCLQIKCANPVTVWLKIRSKHPHLFYGLRYTNKIKTEIEVLKEEDLRIKYRNSVDMCERNKSVHSKQIAEFKALGLIDENDCVAKCLTPNDEIIQRIKTVIENMMDEFSNIAPSTPQRTHSNAAQFYKPQDFTTIYNNRDNYFVNNFYMPEQQQVAIQDK
uniref:Bro-e n=1 Tax=Spodoptera frugiperda granulovirus TaxID=307454 RepID=A0A346QW14_9BBAC|nr:bro-e [Spodoptera frugiperda granulovirus]